MASPDPSPPATAFEWTFLPVREFAAHRGAWQELNTSGRPTPLLSAAFLEPLIEEFATGGELLAVCRASGRVEAMAIVRSVGNGRWETFQPSQAPIGAWLQRPRNPSQDLAASLLRALPGFALMFSITQQDPDLLPRPPESERVSVLDYINTARITITGSFDDYWARRGKNLKHNMKRQRARLEKDGVRLTLDVVSRPEDVAQAIADYGALETAGWKAEGGTAISPDNAQGRFYGSLLERFCKAGMGTIYRYRFDDRVVAMDLCIEGNNTLVILKTTYDETIKTSSPAALMRQEAFEALYASKRIKRIEFYGKIMEWHSRWSDEARTMYHINCYRWPVVSAVWHLARAARRRPTVPAASSSLPAEVTWQLFPATEFARHAQAWQALVSQRKRTPPHEAAFIEPMVAVFGTPATVLAICGDPAAPCAMGLLERNRVGWQTFQPSQAPLSPWVHSTGVSYEDLLPGLVKALPGFPLVVGLTQRDPENHERPEESRNLRTLDYVRTGRIPINKPFDEYWSGRSHNVIRQTERRLRRLDENGIEQHLEAITDTEGIRRGVAEFGDLESAGWKGKAGTAVHSSNPQGVFYAKVMEEFGKLGRGVVYRYRFNDATVAMELCIDDGETLLMLKTTYDEGYRFYGPGFLMRCAILRSVFTKKGLRRVEFLGRLQPWQEKWCDEFRTIYHVNYYRWPLLAHIDEVRRLRSFAQAGDPIPAG
jgi:CelD/BcsL family acetyltransferase involved in cellulose biosynthesis